MSIKLRILAPLLALVAIAALISVTIGLLGHADHEAMSSLAGNAIKAGDMSRKAHDDFDSIGALVAEVTGMTHFVDPKTIQQRFMTDANATEADLASMKAVALSARMSDLAQGTIDRFSTWRRQAEVVLGLGQARELVQIDILKRDADIIKRSLNDALALAGIDAKARIEEAGRSANSQTMVLLSLAGALTLAGIGGAFWLAHNLSQPLKQLVLNAEKLAAGDVSVSFAASHRRDEIGEISRAFARFRDNVTAAKRFEADAAASQTASAAVRDRTAAERAVSAEEQAEVVRRLGQGLKALAAGNLTARVQDGFSEAYVQIKNDFNDAIDTLKDTMRAVVLSADAIQVGTQEISAASADLSRRTEQQAASLEETASTLDELTATVRKSAESATHARHVVSAAESDAKKSALVVREAVDAMGAIAQSAAQISQIIGVIDEIAFQTNLLALNAGVEAARAGDTGRGFAVVASEVRALAQRCADAAKEIKGLISTSTVQVDQGVRLVAETGQSLDRIMAQVTEINGIVGQIAEGAREQASGLGQVNSAITQMDQVTQQNAAMVEESAAASHKLSQETLRLSTLIDRFQVDQGDDDDTMRRRLQAVAPHAFRSSSSASDGEAARLTSRRPSLAQPRRSARA